MAPLEDKAPITPNFNSAASDTYLQSQFNEAASGHPNGEETQTTETPGQNHDLESDLHSLGGSRDDPELAGYKSFAEQADAQQASDADILQEFQNEYEGHSPENDNDSSIIDNNPKSDFDLSM